MTPAVVPQLVANDAPRALRAAIADPERFACEPKVDGVRGLVIYDQGDLQTRNRQGQRRDWFRGDSFEKGLRRLGARLPILWEGCSPQAFELPLELSLLVEPRAELVEAMQDGRLEGIVLKDRRSTYGDGSWAGWTKVKDRSWYEREAWRTDSMHFFAGEREVCGGRGRD